MKATNVFFFVFLSWLLGVCILLVQGNPTKDIGHRKDVETVTMSNECDDEDGCDGGSGNEEKLPVKGSVPTLKKDAPAGGNEGTNKGSATYEIIHKSVKSKDQESTPVDAFTGDDSSHSWSNKGRTNIIYEIISKSITKGNKEFPKKDCDDEDDCGSAADVFNNDGSGDGMVKDKNSEETTYYEVISKSLVGKDVKPPVDAFSNGGSSSSSSNEGNGKPVYEIIFKSFDTKNKHSTPTDAFTGEESSKLGSLKSENERVVYEIISKSVTQGKKEPSGKDCDDEDECGSADGAIPKEKKSGVIDAFTGEETKSNSQEDGLLYEIIYKSIDTAEKISKKDCDDEDDCGSAIDVFINQGNDDRVSNGHSPSKEKNAPDKPFYQIISKSMVKKDDSTPTDAFGAQDSSSSSSNKGQTQVIYEIISKSVTKGDKSVAEKNCDDEDECGSADDVFTNDGSGDSEERLSSKNENVPSGKTTFYQVISKSMGQKKESPQKDVFTADYSDDSRYEIISKSVTTGNQRSASKECSDDDEDCPLPNVGSGDDTFSARRAPAPPKYEVLTPQVESNVQPLFRGNSFLKLPSLGKDAQDNTEAEMEIFPLEKTGILLYNGWKPNKIGDFISLSLQDGFVELSYDCRSGPIKIRTGVPVKLSEWNKIQFFRSGRLGSLTLNDNNFAMGMSPEPRSALTLTANLMVGGISEELRHEVSENVGIDKGFTGYIRNFKIQGKEVHVTSIDGNIRKNHCLSFPCQHGGQCVQNGDDYSCFCKAQFRGRHCTEEIEMKAVSFHKDSYLRYNQAALMKILQGEDGFVTFLIMTTHSKGMLIWEAQKFNQHFQRYATVGLTVGYISLRFNLGAGNTQIYSSVPVDDGEWHNVTIGRSNGFSSLTIDGQHKKEFSPINNGLEIRKTVDFYIGGMPDIKSATKGLHKIGFKGCLKSFEVNSKYLDFNHEYIASHNVRHCGENLN